MTVLVPVLNEEGTVAELVERVRRVLDELGRSFELVFIDDGSQDATVERIRAEHDADRRIKLVRLRRNFGKAAALSAGIEHSSGRLVVTLDGARASAEFEGTAAHRRLDQNDSATRKGAKRIRDGLAAAAMRYRFEGNPHLALKSLELTRYLAKLLLQPGPDAPILVPFSGSGSETIGAMLAGWPEVVAIEGSEQWVEVNRRRAAFWKPLAELGARDASIQDLLGEWHEKPAGAAEDLRQASLFEE